MKKIFVGISILLLSIACSSSDSDGGGSDDVNFDRSAILVSWADDFIIPQYEAFLTDTEALVVAKDIFLADPTEANLVSLRENLTEAYISFQPAGTYADLGLGGELNYYLNLNAHAVNVDDVLTNLPIFDTVNFSSSLEQDAQGLPAIDYFVNGLGATDAEIVSFYTGSDAENYLGYLSLVVDRIENLTQQVVDDWNTSFRDEFVTNTSSSSTGSFDIFINAYIEYFERRLRSSKVGTPAGVFTTNPFPEQIESLYNPTLSKALLQEALNNAEELYLGKSNSEISLSSILIDLANPVVESQEELIRESELDNTLKGFFNAAQTEIDTNLNDNLRLQVETDNDQMLLARTALQRIAATLKADMTSVLGVDIAFADNDGD